MNLRVLRYFLTVAEEKSLTKASERLHISQPPLSKQLKSLEEELDVQLFIRTPYGVELTEEGQYLRMRAEVIFDIIEDTARALRKMKKKDVISIGCVPTVSETFLSQWLYNWKEQDGELTFNIFEGDTNAILKLLNSGEVDIGVVRLPIDTEKYSYKPIVQELTYAVVDGSSELCRENPGDSISFGEVMHQPLILPTRQEAILPLEDTVQDKLNVVCKCHSISQGMLMAKKGIGVSIVPESACKMSMDHGNLKFYKIVSPAFTSTVVITWKKDTVLSPALEKILLS